MAEKDGEYTGSGKSTAEEGERLRQLSESLNPITQRWLERAGLRPGWRVLEVGAAEGSMARWVADQVAPAGRVVAADIDLRFLDGMDHPGVEVRGLDIRTERIDDEYDLAYCRTLLLHLPDHIDALRRLYDALVPGGVLFVHESDMCLFEPVDPGHPDGQVFTDFHRRALTAIRDAKVFDTALGRSLPAAFGALGLEGVEHEILATIQRGNSPMTHQLAVGLGDLLGPELVKTGVIEPSVLETVQRLYADPEFEYLTGVNFGVWGRKPARA